MSNLSENGHLFVRFPLDGVDYCVGCGHPQSAPETAARCADAEGLAEDLAAMLTVAHGALT
ncbi:hypothetical protein ACIQB5_06715 [Streptomyces sp. NPDC088560]|uniref:hypothetical protein n=1 Tax=Streptomyces sp. NPDC088560 TaxID=3365868 RepID=UPI0037FD1F65